MRGTLEAYLPNNEQSCPHCGVFVRLVGADLENLRKEALNLTGIHCRSDEQRKPTVHFSRCPACKKVIIELKETFAIYRSPDLGWESRIERRFVFPRQPFRKAMHEAVPAELLEDYQEALLTLQDSPKASAALSRRCLQHLLVLKGAKQKELIDQIAELQPSFPSHVQGHIDFVRQLGNLSAHPKQSRSTGEIVDVEPGEAEWMIELLEELFDHYYAKPAEAKKRADALKAKYADAGKVTPSPFGP